MAITDAGVAAGGSGAVFYRFRGPDGREHIVDSLDAVPQAERGQMRRVELAPPPERSWLERLNPLPTLDWPSFALGFGAALVVGLVVGALRRRAGPLVKLALLGVLVLVAGGAYLGWVRRQAAFSGAALATPRELIDDAKSAVERMNQRTREQQKLLDDVEKNAR